MDHVLIPIGANDLWNQINAKHLQKGGVYKIIAFCDGQRVPINRFLGTDQEGVLYIGKATSFIDRVIALKKSISPDFNGSSHICGRRYKSNENIAKKFPFNQLYIDLIATDAPLDLEKSLLKEYSLTYGEVPPLNAV